MFKARLTRLVLGHPWLHNPHIDWEKGKILGWRVNCHIHCIRDATPPVHAPLDPPDLSAVLGISRVLQEVFCKDGARSLSPHRLYDCVIDLLSYPKKDKSLRACVDYRSLNMITVKNK